MDKNAWHDRFERVIETDDSEHTGIVIVRVKSKHWQHVDTNEIETLGHPRPVGPIYSTLREANDDHDDYIRRAGWLV